MTNHSYLLVPGHWAGEGWLIQETAEPLAARSTAVIEHAPGIWRMTSIIESEASVLETVYEIEPTDAGGGDARWRAVNPTFGPLEGKFRFIDDVIYSEFHGHGGELVGNEVLRMTGEGRYVGRGHVREGAHLRASWAVRIDRRV